MTKEMLELKRWLKKSGKEIHKRKQTLKEHQRNGYDRDAWNSLQWQMFFDNIHFLYRLQWEYRHMHISYSELRGHTRDQIEASYPYEGMDGYEQKPDEKWIKKIKSTYSCACSQVAEGGGF